MKFETRGRNRPNIKYAKSDSIITECDNITRRTKLPVRGDIIALRFYLKKFFSCFLGLSLDWDFKKRDDYFGERNINLNKIDKINLKCDVIDGPSANGLRHSILFSFVLCKPSGCKVSCPPEIIHYEKVHKSVLNTITFYLEDDNHKEVIFNGETLTFTLQLIKI